MDGDAEGEKEFISEETYGEEHGREIESVAPLADEDPPAVIAVRDVDPLISGLIDMVQGRRLTEDHIPEDFAWLCQHLARFAKADVTIPGPFNMANIRFPSGVTLSDAMPAGFKDGFVELKLNGRAVPVLGPDNEPETDGWKPDPGRVMVIRDGILRDDARIATALAVLGNVDHSRGGGRNSAKMYGEMLESIREILSQPIAVVVNDGIAVEESK